MQDDQPYAPADREYGQSRIGIPFARLRTVAGQHVFTVKRPTENVLSCEEFESSVADRVGSLGLEAERVEDTYDSLIRAATSV